MLSGYATDVISVGANLGAGIRRQDGKRVAGVLVIDAVKLLANPAVRENVRSTIELLGLFDELSGIELYVICERNQPQTLSMAGHHARAMVATLDLDGLDTKVFVGHFLNKEKSEYVFGM